MKKKILGIVNLGSHDSGGLVATSARRLFLSNKDLKDKRFDLVDGNVMEGFTWGKNIYALEEKRGYEQTQKCLLKQKSSFFAHYNFNFEERHNISLHLGENLCLDSHFKGERFQKLPNELNFQIYGAQKKVAQTCRPDPLKFYGFQEDYIEDDEDDRVNIIQQRVDDQTQRIGLKFYAQKFYDEIPPLMEFEEWKFLETALYIFRKTCPVEMVSEYYMENVLLLFQFLLQESFNLFPPNVDEDKDTRLRIWTALRRCEGNATKMAFKNFEPCSKKVSFCLIKY